MKGEATAAVSIIQQLLGGWNNIEQWFASCFPLTFFATDLFETYFYNYSWVVMSGVIIYNLIMINFGLANMNTTWGQMMVQM